MPDADLIALLVEDDPRLAQLTAAYLERHQISVTCIADGAEGLALAQRARFDVVLLDVMLPSMSGIEVCQALRRQSDVPIIMISARGEEADKVIGLELGADDYLAKPYSPRELLARIRTTVRRARGRMGPRVRALTVGGLALDPGARRAHLDGALLDLTSYEFGLLYALAERAGRVLPRERLMELAGVRPEDAFDRSVDVHVSRLRHKLGDDPRKPRFIKTIRGAGYQFIEPTGHPA